MRSGMQKHGGAAAAWVASACDVQTCPLIQHACAQVFNLDTEYAASYALDVSFQDTSAVVLVASEQRALASIFTKCAA